MDALKHIELFAGCGGMSLGLENSGFELYFANELSPMASETFAYNILNENLEDKSKKKEIAKNVFWIKSNYPKDNLIERLKENPFTAREGKESDLSNITDLKGKLLVGDIDQLLDFLNEPNNKTLKNTLKKQNIDLLSGGPPCQSFSLAGKREKNNRKNLLPLSFAKISGLIQPKVVLLENVKGITAPFTEDGHKYYAWLEVSKAFVLEGFVPICMMLNSKYFGVAQNRPRFILFAFRKDIFEKIKLIYPENNLLLASEKFYEIVNKHTENLSEVTIKDFKFYDIESEPELFDGEILPKIYTPKGEFITAKAAINDIRNTKIKSFDSFAIEEYGSKLNSTFKSKFKIESITNHDPRIHSINVKSRFRFYQIINEFKNGLKKGASDLLAGKNIPEEIQRKIFEEFLNHKLLFLKDGKEAYKKLSNTSEVKDLVKSIPTKKHSQRALLAIEPAPAQLTIPDDICHYDPEILRTMTVREMARFQSFPDWFEFRSKVTTGGQLRKFQVPQYTQVGNAVPPLLAKALGEIISKLLKDIL